MAKLDKSRHYAEHFGPNSVGKYSQDGKVFDRNGDEMTPAAQTGQSRDNEAKMKAADEALARDLAAKQKQPDAPVNRQVAAQLAE